MPNFIFRQTSRELRDNLRASARGDSRIRGTTRTTEEAHDIERRLSREGEAFVKPFLVSGDAPESKQARMEIAIRMGSKDPERDEGYV